MVTSNQFADDSDINKRLRIIKNMRDKVTPDMIAAMHKEADQILEYRVKETGKKSWQSLTSGYWEYEFIFNGGEMSKPGEMSGNWVNFDDNLTYQYGYYENTIGKGRYHYDLDEETLLMVDTKSGIKPNEYEVKMTSDVIVLIGKDTYKDNNYQTKIKKVGNQPQKDQPVQ